MPGEVWLVGAGPGDPGLLTLSAAHALKHADVVVHDALVGPGVLALAREGAEMIPAGKRGGKPSAKQPDITERIIELARSGLRVLRLKGGDPFVFGRGGEEAMALALAGIRFRVVPGVTAGIAGLATAGIPATHRTTNAAVVFITGHDAKGDTPQAIDWAALARMPAIVIYMGLSHLDDIARRLIAAGRRPDEPVALIEQATMPGARVIETVLASAVEDASKHGVEPPVIIAIGANVGLRAAIMRGHGAREEGA
ncbi:MAG: uroporphyrinogen-III C-methyltransferase [Rhizobiales bacterium]|nr:uroporphyrinogen-III C-methyltransferase [Hyphomicrobiales bacterium]